MFTSNRSWFRGVIDHIFYSTESNIRVVRVLQGLPSVWLRENGIVGLPTANIPSDHVPLAVDFLLTQHDAINEADVRPEVEMQTGMMNPISNDV